MILQPARTQSPTRPRNAGADRLISHLTCISEAVFPHVTTRLLLRLLVPDDIDAIRHLYSDWEIAK